MLSRAGSLGMYSVSLATTGAGIRKSHGCMRSRLKQTRVGLVQAANHRQACPHLVKAEVIWCYFCVRWLLALCDVSLRRSGTVGIGVIASRFALRSWFGSKEGVDRPSRRRRKLVGHVTLAV